MYGGSKYVRITDMHSDIFCGQSLKLHKTIRLIPFFLPYQLKSVPTGQQRSNTFLVGSYIGNYIKYPNELSPNFVPCEIIYIMYNSSSSCGGQDLSLVSMYTGVVPIKYLQSGMK
jgi:hypothetical protein